MHWESMDAPSVVSRRPSLCFSFLRFPFFRSSPRFSTLALPALSAWGLGLSACGGAATPMGGSVPMDGGTDAGMAEAPLVVDEVSAQGTDWIELRNAGTEALSLRGLRVTDGGDAPDQEHLTALPRELSLAPGERLVVICKPTPLLEGLVTGAACPVEGVERCIHADFKISHGNGDTLFVVDSVGRIADQLRYTPEAAAEGQSWCRLSDGADPVPCMPTPGATNRAAEAS